MNKPVSLIFSLIFLFLFSISLPAQAQEEEGELCEVESADVVLIVDRTPSVDADGLAEQTSAAHNFIDELTAQPGVNVGIVALGRNLGFDFCGNGASLEQALSTDATALKNAVSNALASTGSILCGTNVAGALDTATAELGNGNGVSQYIILLSDGQANAPNPDPDAAALASADNAKDNEGITIFTIAYDAEGSGQTFIDGRELMAQIATQPSEDNFSPGGDDAGTSPTEAFQEDTDGDYFFIDIAGAADLEAVLEIIIQGILCDDGNPCTTDICNDNNMCENTPREGCIPCADDSGNPDDTLCDDGLYCNGVETCDTEELTCNLGTDVVCDDGLACNGEEVCNEETDSCDAGTPFDCDDQEVCTDDSCVEGDNGPTCQYDPNQGACEDGDQCTEPDMCSGGSCQSGGPKNCDDGDVCNGTETCNPAFGCQPGTPLDCDDGNPCTVDSCDPAGGCMHVPMDNLCDDGLFCNGAETCDIQLGCQAGTPPVVDDGVGCTNDVCDEATDQVINTPDNSLCTDNDVCNGVEVCDPTNDCQAGTPLDCTDGVSCTVDSCDPAGGCQNTPDDSLCNDGDVCNGMETCDAQDDCQAGTPLVVDDGDACTDDSCDPEGGVMNDPVDPDDGNVCTADSCDSESGVINEPIEGCCLEDEDCAVGEFCNEGNECQDRCGDGVLDDVEECDLSTGIDDCPEGSVCSDSCGCEDLPPGDGDDTGGGQETPVIPPVTGPTGIVEGSGCGNQLQPGANVSHSVASTLGLMILGLILPLSLRRKRSRIK